MPYNIVVLAKQVPDTKKITGKAMKDDGTVNRAALPAIFNPEDLNALELALEVKDRYGGKVTVLYRAADNTPMMTNLDYETSSWSAPTQPVYLPDTGFPGTSYSFAWSPRGAINQVPKTGEYDRHLYIFYGVHFWEMYTDEGWYEWYMHDEGILGP